jgi:hypothetical protein
MSYDITFWKLAKRTEQTPEEIYASLSAGKIPSCVAKLPVKKIVQELQKAFPDFDPKESYPMVETPAGSIEFSYSTAHFRFDFRPLHEASFNRIVSIMAKFGCPQYDPGLDKRYDTDHGLKVGRALGLMKPAQKAKVPNAMRYMYPGLDFQRNFADAMRKQSSRKKR